MDPDVVRGRDDREPESGVECELGDPFERELAELIDHLEADPTFDVDAFVDRRPERASALRAALTSLTNVGVLFDRGAMGPSLARLGVAHVLDLTLAVPAEPAPSTDADFIHARYRVLGEIGSGGMGRVLRAFDTELGREVALKLCRVPPDASQLAVDELFSRFVHEARITSRLEHPSIVPVHDFGLTVRGDPYFTMKLVRGRTLLEIVDQQARRTDGVERWSVARRVEVVLRIADALSYGHARGVVHRDLKPSNVMIGDFGEVLVMDWGLARDKSRPQARPTFLAGGHRSAFDSLDGERLGSPRYMSPEQARGDVHTIDVRTDVFGLGALLLHVATGRPPWAGPTLDAVVANAKSGSRDDPGYARSAFPVPRELRAICDKALAFRPEDRYATVEAVADDLRRYLAGERGVAWRDGAWTRLEKRVRARPAAAIAACGLCLCFLLASFAILERSWRRALDEDVYVRRVREALPALAARSPTRVIGSSQMDYGAQCMDFVRALRAVHAHFDLERDAADFDAAFERLRVSDARVASELELELLDAVTLFARAGAIALALERAGVDVRVSPRLSARQLLEARQRREKTRQSHPRAVDAWCALERVLASNVVDPWRRDVLQSHIAWIETGIDRFDEPLAAAHSRSGREVAWLATLIRTVRGAEHAQALLAEAVERDGRSFEARFQLARAWTDSPDWRRWARPRAAQLEAAVALEPRSAWAWSNLGLAHVDVARTTQEVFNTLSSDAVEARSRLAADIDESLEHANRCYRRAIEVDATIGVAWSNLANNTADLHEREALHRRAFALEPCNFGIAASSAAFFEGLGRNEEAVEVLDKYWRNCEVPDERLGRDLALTCHLLAQQAAGRGDRGTSATWYDRFVEVFECVVEQQVPASVHSLEYVTLLFESGDVQRLERVLRRSVERAEYWDASDAECANGLRRLLAMPCLDGSRSMLAESSLSELRNRIEAALARHASAAR